MYSKKKQRRSNQSISRPRELEEYWSYSNNKLSQCTCHFFLFQQIIHLPLVSYQRALLRLLACPETRSNPRPIACNFGAMASPFVSVEGDDLQRSKRWCPHCIFASLQFLISSKKYYIIVHSLYIIQQTHLSKPAVFYP